MRIRDFSGGAYGSRRGRRIKCERSFRCVDCGKLRYLTRGELSRAARPHCLDCGGCLEETATSRRRQEVSDERIERQHVALRCRICGVGFIDEDSLANHLRENRDCAKQYQKLLTEEKNRKPSLFSNMEETRMKDEHTTDEDVIEKAIITVMATYDEDERDWEDLTSPEQLARCFQDRASILACIEEPSDVLKRVMRTTKLPGEVVLPKLQAFLGEELQQLDDSIDELLQKRCNREHSTLNNLTPSFVSFEVEYKDHNGKRQKTQVSAENKLHAAAIVRGTLASLVLKCTPLRNGGKKC